MSQDYTYDEQGQFFPYFVAIVTGAVTIPVTYSLLKPSQVLESTATRIQTDFQPDHADLIEEQKRKQKRRERGSKRLIVSVVGWATIAWMIYLMVVTARTIPKVWDPYDVLGISRSATEKQVKSHYRRLSLTQHPDKVQLDPAQNITSEVVNERWVEITKAFKALTDAEIRENYLKYGHPDGKQSFSIGIALPKFIIQEGNGKYVLLLYAGLLGVFLPYLVGTWWYGTQRVTREKVLVSTAGKLFREYEENIKSGGVVSALSSGEEYKEILRGDQAENGLSKLEQAIFSDTSSTAMSTGLTSNEKSKLQNLDEGVRRKVLGLLWAYLRRVELNDKTLNAEKFDVAPTAVQLVDSFLAIANAFSNAGPVLSAYNAQQLLIQAIPPGASPLLQLPHFNADVIKAIEGDDAPSHMDVQDFMDMADAKRKRLTVGPGLLSQEQYQRAVKVAKQLPLLSVEHVFFKVTGEKFVLPSSLVSLVIKARIIPPGSQNVPEVDEEELEDPDPVEGDLDALHGRKKGEEEKTYQPPLTNSPYYSRDHSPRWHLLLTDGKAGKIAVPASTYTTFDKAIVDDNGKYTYNMQTIKMQFGAPPQPGEYQFLMHLVCDSYVGLDTKIDVTLAVEDPSKAADVVEEEDISEPEEDSIAGQMSALKGGAVKKRQPQADAESSDDDSDTEGEEGSDSETDTDTETESDEE